MLRTYQVNFVADLYNLIRQGQTRILGVAPTGAGKTIISAEIVRDAVAANLNVLFLVHRRTLIAQTIGKFQQFGLDCGTIGSRSNDFQTSNLPRSVQVCTVQTLINNPWVWRIFCPSLVIADECHITSFDRALLNIFPPLRDRIRQDPCIYLGLTATPWRSKAGEELGDIFLSLVQAPSPLQLMRVGHLVKPSYFVLEEVDLSGARVMNGEWSDKDLELIMNDRGVTENAINEWLTYAKNRPTLTFCTAISHAVSVTKSFVNRGIPSAIVASRIPLGDKQYFLDRGIPFASGKAKDRESIYSGFGRSIVNIVSVGALTEGFDQPIASCALVLRPVRSSIALWHQMVGRVIRSSPGKRDAIVLDPSGNTNRHGRIEEIQEYELKVSVPIEVESRGFAEKERDEVERDDLEYAVGRLALSLGDEDFSFYKALVHLFRNFPPREAIKRFTAFHGEPSITWCRVALEEIYGDNFEPYLWQIAPEESPLLWRLSAG